MKVIRLYIEYDYNARAVIRELGYPSRNRLAIWYKEYQKHGTLFKKRSRYGTVIVDEVTHKPGVVLGERDSNTLKAWLSQNRQVKRITRDRAGAYASAIGEIRPDAMQIAVRFIFIRICWRSFRTHSNQLFQLI